MKTIALLLFGALVMGLEPRAGVMASTPAAGSIPAAARFDSAASAPGSSVSPDSAAAAVPQRDVFDLLREYILHREFEPEVSGTIPIGLSWAILPTLSYNPVYGLAVGAMISGAGWRGAESTRFSQLSISGNISTTGQIQAQARGDIFSHGGNYLLKLDVRYLDTKRSTWGLGPISSSQIEYPMDFRLARLYGTMYRRANGPVFIGIGYHYDEFYDIVDAPVEEGETTPFLSYHGAALSRTVATGLSLNVLGDTRDNLANPSSGYYLSSNFRDYMRSLGSDENWQEMWIEMRVYPHLPSGSRNVLAFWLYGWMTFGKAPYLNLPSNGWDMYGRASRGYLQGRIRGANQVYLESEYRWALTRDGLWGAVAFLNGACTTDPNTGIFGRPDWAAGTGLRIKFNKTSNTNLAIDYGWGTHNSSGFFLGMSEVF